jgi:hypothetical protein
VFSDPLTAATTDSLAGVGTHLGHFTGTYPHQVNFATLTFSGIPTFTAANGDELTMQLGGTASPSPTSATTFGINLQGTITGGTGRFAGAAGSVTGTGTVDLVNSQVRAGLQGLINKEDIQW